MIVHDAAQGTAAWQAARLGIPTASRFSEILTPAKLEPSKSADAYIDELVADWLNGEAEDAFQGTHWTDRGHALESKARAYFALETGETVESVGFVYRDEHRSVGCSPDGMIWRKGGAAGLELKCPKGKTHQGYLRPNILPPAYKMQVQGCMWVCDVSVWYFMSYHPQAPALIVAVERDERTSKALDAHMPDFLGRLEYQKQWNLDRGAVPLSPVTEDLK